MSPKSPRNVSHHLASAAIVSLSLIGALQASAATYTWSGASSGEFEVAPNWGGTAPANDLSSDIGLFTGSVTSNGPTITTSRSISGLNFQSAGWTLGGSAGAVLTLGNDGITSVGAGINTISADVALGANQTWNIASGNTLNIGGALGGTQSVTVTGGGSLSLSSLLSFNGQMIVNSGTVNALTGGTISTSGTTGSLTVNNGGTFVSGTSLTIGGTTAANNRGVVNLNGGLLSVTTGTLVVGNATSYGTLNMTSGTLTAMNLWGRGLSRSVFNFSGGTINVSVGMNVNLSGAFSLGDGVGTAAILNIAGTDVPNATSWSSGIAINADGTLNVDNSQAARTNRIDDNQIFYLNGGTFNFLGGNTNVNDIVSTLSINQGSSVFSMTPYASRTTVLSATGGMTRTGGATILFRGTSLGVSGTTTANTAHLVLGNGASQLVGTSTTGSGVTNLAILPYAVGDTTSTGLGSDFVTYSSTNGVRILSANEYTALVSTSATDSNVKLATTDTLSTSGTINSLILNNGGVVNGAAAALTINSGALLAVGAGNQISTGTLSFGSREGIVTTNGSLTIDSVIAGSNATNGLTKSGTGTLTLTGANTYTGATTINQGTISISADSQLGNSAGGIVFSSGTLATTANGSTSRAITLNNSGGTFSPDNETQWTLNGILSGTGGLTVNGQGTLVLGAANTYAGTTTVLSGSVRLEASQTPSSGIVIGGGGSSAVLDLGQYTLTLASGQTVTINSEGTLLLSGTGNSTVVNRDIAVYGGTIQNANNANSSSNTLSGNVTLYDGAVLSTNSSTTNGALAYMGRLAISGNFAAYAGSTISSNENGYVAFTGTNIFIDSGVTLTSGSLNNSGRTPMNMLTLSRSSGTQILTSNSALDTVFIRDLNTYSNTATTILNVGAIEGGNIGQIYVNNIDSATTTVQLANNLKVIAGKGIINQNPSSSSAATAPVALDLNGFTYDASSASTGWAPNTSGTQQQSPWVILSSNGTGTFRASSFNLTGTNTDVTIGSNVVMEATSADNTTDLGIKAGGSGTIDPTSTFLFTGDGNHYLKSSNSRTIGNLQAGNAVTSSTISLSSDITTGNGSSLTVLDGSELAMRWYNLSTSGAVNLSGGKISGDGSGAFSVSGDITASGNNNSSISAPITLAGSGNQNIVVQNAGTNLSISGGIGGGARGITKNGAGSATLGGNSTYSGATVVDQGELNVNGSLSASSAVSVHNSATLNGSGSVGAVHLDAGGTIKGSLTAGAISGSGLVSPGNSPGILTATSVDGSTGLDFAFEFTKTGDPLYGNATASGNDLLRLTGATPFAGNLDASNTISIYLSSGSIGSTYLGGIFADNLTAGLLKTAVEGAAFEYWVLDTDGIHDLGDTQFNGTWYTTLDSSVSVAVTAVDVTAGFSSGSASGSELEFTVVPEPSTWALILGGCGMLAFGQRSRRRWKA